MGHYVVDGIVLRSYKLGEADRILNVLTANRGKVRAVAKGVRKPGSRFGGRLEPYGHVQLQLYEGRNLDIVSQAELITSFVEVREDWVASACAATMAEACDKLAQEGERATSMFLLLKDALGVLAAGPEQPAAVLDAFLMRLSVLEGFRPELDACVTCGTTEDIVAFHVGGGGVLCARDTPSGLQRVGPDVLDQMRQLTHGPWAEIVSGGGTSRRVGALVRSYLSYHLTTNLKAWEAVPR
ncbi:DNA repair protein RecO [Euzebya tangerina]|uniref:DNA repair protein RecO n=1 Tax=Euzebya tangerina TaxID=591198 RepID=UPI0013C2B9E1|nr:DNA repair protein RecO [Euzebya tangerina]